VLKGLLDLQVQVQQDPLVLKGRPVLQVQVQQEVKELKVPRERGEQVPQGVKVLKVLQEVKGFKVLKDRSDLQVDQVHRVLKAL
jgi:hypothetical protein